MSMNRRGFTLLEILLALALASLLLSSIYGIFTASSAAKERVEKRAAGLHLARVLTARLNRELLGLALEGTDAETLLAGGTNSRGEAFLSMLTSSSGGRRPGLRRVAYRLGVDEDERMTLWRAESGSHSLAGVVEERLAQGIDRIDFDFYDGSDWRRQWNSTDDGLPVLVRAEIALSDLADRPALQSVFDLPQRTSQ